MVFQEIAPPQAHKIQKRSDLESELFGGSEQLRSVSHIRENEGEAAEYGVYYDDTEYDYMQHLRDLNSGDGSGESYFVEAPKAKKGKGKEKVSLEDALKEATLQDKTGEGSETSSQLLDNDILPSRNLKSATYQDQQDIPDALAGFQPDMDPRLREVLEALEDEAYVDNEEEIFGEIARDQEVSLVEFEDGYYGDEAMGEEDEGWESDDTAKPTEKFKSATTPSDPQMTEPAFTASPNHGDGGWMKEFSKFKQAEKAQKEKPVASNAEQDSSIITGTSMTGGRRKKRKGSLASSTGFSMTSSSLLRTEGHTLLDARFDKIEEDYAEDEMRDDEDIRSVVTGTSSASSQAPSLRSDFDNIMDEFLGGYPAKGKKRAKKARYQSGMAQLDEIRKELGPPRIKVERTMV